MFIIKFKKFDFQGFINFVLKLVDKYRMVQIRFNPERRELFNETQLRHIAPNRTINDENGFVWAWIRKQKEVRKVNFELFSDDNSLKIIMSIDLNKCTISLDKTDGISSVQVEETLKENFDIKSLKYSKIDKIKDFLFLIWNNKIVSGVIIGLIVAYFVFIFGWN
jgi:hypothetical protein